MQTVTLLVQQGYSARLLKKDGLRRPSKGKF